jgi:hypothetical protein
MSCGSCSGHVQPPAPRRNGINPVVAMNLFCIRPIVLDGGLLLFAEALILQVRGLRGVRANTARTASLLKRQRSANEKP